MEVSTRAKERFCKDCSISIRLFQEPYFTDRLKLFDKFYGTLEKWNVFTEELKKYNCEQDYFEEYNHIKDAAINCIKSSEAYERFNTDDMNKYRVIHKNLPSSNVFKRTNDGRVFISIDMRKANFSALKHYDKEIFGTNTWEEFMGKFTSNRHIINSKYIRQVILGNCNPKRQITYEKYLMDQTLFLLEDVIDEEKLVFFSNDEIIYDVTDENDQYALGLVRDYIEKQLAEKSNIPFSVELFTLHRIENTSGYYKKIIDSNRKCNIEFKCLNNYMLPFVLRSFLGEEITDSDKVFFNEGLLAQFIEVPEIEVK